MGKKGKGAVDSEEGVKNWLKRFDKDSCEEMTDALSEAEALDIMNDKLCPQMIDVLTKCIQGCQHMNFRCVRSVSCDLAKDAVATHKVQKEAKKVCEKFKVLIRERA